MFSIIGAAGGGIRIALGAAVGIVCMYAYAQFFMVPEAAKNERNRIETAALKNGFEFVHRLRKRYKEVPPPPSNPFEGL